MAAFLIQARFFSGPVVKVMVIATPSMCLTNHHSPVNHTEQRPEASNSNMKLK